jgi:hypothetical protein
MFDPHLVEKAGRFGLEFYLMWQLLYPRGPASRHLERKRA